MFHVDFNYHKYYGLYRRLNVLIYLNKNWKPDYGGEIQLWDKNMKNCIKKVEPLFNRGVVFETSDFSYHGHPDPLNTPKGVTRKSIALYYYTSKHGNQKLEAHWTRHLKRPGSGDDVHRGRKSLSYWGKQLTPPIINKIVDKIRLR